MTLAKRWCALGVVALFALQFLWHAWLLPPERLSPWIAAGLGALPILPSLVLHARRHRHAAFWGAVAALLYFCHGVMEAWTTREAWAPALAEAFLAAWVVVCSSWDGMRARFARKPAAPPAV